jgi:hypothetical protein
LAALDHRTPGTRARPEERSLTLRARDRPRPLKRRTILDLKIDGYRHIDP